MAIAPLIVKIGADTSGLESGLKRSAAGLAGMAKAAAAAGVLVAGALTAMTVKGLSAVDAQVKLARSLDGSANALRAVQIAAGYAGVSVGEADTAMQNLNRELERAKEVGTPAQEALAKLGMTAEDLQRLDVDERMATLADRMSELGISSGQASDILRDLGVRSRNMALLMLQGGDAIRAAREEVRDFGLELTRAQTDSIESANDSVARMGLVFEGLRNQLSANIAPALKVVADRFGELAKSESVQAAIERLADAFGRLAEVILSEDFIGAAIKGLEAMAGVAGTVAESMITVSQNIEMVTLALSGAAIAAAGLGAPLLVVGGLLAAALGGIAAWRGEAEDMAAGSDTAKAAQEALNKALGVFHTTGAPSAGKAAVALANDNYKLAESALAAADAEIAKMKAAESSMRSMVASRGGVISMEAEAMLSAQEASLARERMAAEKAIEEARVMMDRAARSVTGSDYGPVTLPTVSPDGDDSGEGGEDTAIPGLDGGGAVADQMAQRLEALQAGLMTEREAIDAWYEQGLEVLQNARAAELLTEEEYRAQRERLEQEHQDRLAGIRRAGNDAAFSSIVGTGQEILRAIGQNNDKAAKAAQTLGAFEAMVNAYRAASQALADPKLPWYAKVAAAGSLLATGIGFANSIKSMSKSNPSSGGGGGGGSSSASAATAQVAPTNYYFDIQGDTFSRASVESTLAAALQSEVDRGARIVFSGA